jgi:hypothetical protein
MKTNVIFSNTSCQIFSPTSPHIMPQFLGPYSVSRRRRRRWVDNIKMDRREVEWDGMGWIDLAQDRDQWRALVNTVMNLRVP